MFDPYKEMVNFHYREVEVALQQIFPRMNLQTIQMRFKHLQRANPHETIYLVARALSEGGYAFLLQEQG
ncbi:MAG: hypothetical protein RL736_866, partial [Pseudomonadota bacterium]